MFSKPFDMRRYVVQPLPVDVIASLRSAGGGGMLSIPPRAEWTKWVMKPV